jgi:hypothetical protein
LLLALTCNGDDAVVKAGEGFDSTRKSPLPSIRADMPV